MSEGDTVIGIAKHLATASQIVEKAEALLKVVLRPGAEELGQLLREKIAERRYTNLLKIAARAKDQIKAAGLSPKEVPLAIIHPLLESASLEESDDLQERWAALLANMSVSEKDVLRCFTDILRQLTSVEARFLDRAYDETLEQQRNPREHYLGARKYPILEATLGMLVTSMIANLERLGLITRQSHDHKTFTDFGNMVVTAASNRLYISDLGMEFVEACRPPHVRTSNVSGTATTGH